MGKVIRQRLPTEYSIGILILIFALTFFLSGRLFEVTSLTAKGANIYIGMTLASATVIIMILILWEELMFPIKIDSSADEVLYRNHPNKLRIQTFIYLSIPATVGFLLYSYELNLYIFIPWAAVCLVAPVAGKLVSGINNYHDFLRISAYEIEYKNNKEEGLFPVRVIRSLVLEKDRDEFLSKLIVTKTDGDQVTIDLDEMELEEFYENIEQYILTHFGGLLHQPESKDRGEVKE